MSSTLNNSNQTPINSPIRYKTMYKISIHSQLSTINYPVIDNQYKGTIQIDVFFYWPWKNMWILQQLLRRIPVLGLHVVLFCLDIVGYAYHQLLFTLDSRHGLFLSAISFHVRIRMQVSFSFLPFTLFWILASSYWNCWF